MQIGIGKIVLQCSILLLVLSGCRFPLWYRTNSTQYIIPEPEPVTTSIVPINVNEDVEMPQEGSSVYGVTKKETAFLELKITDYFDQKTSQKVFESVMFHTLDVRIKPSEDWKRVTQYTSQDGLIHTGNGGIIVFSDTEVGVATFRKPYFLTLDGVRLGNLGNPRAVGIFIEVTLGYVTLT